MSARVPAAESPVGPVLDRVLAVFVLGVAVALVWLLGHVQPDARGFGTHEQLGMAPCSWPDRMGVPCPTCGVTTAACYVVHLSPWQALKTQPFGAALAVIGLLLAVHAAFCLATGRAFMFKILLLPYGTIMGWGLALLLGSWLYTYVTFVP